MNAMTTALVLIILVLAAVAVVRQLGANHRRVTAWPALDDARDRDAARVRGDLAATRPAPVRGLARPRVVTGEVTGRRTAPPAAHAA